MLIYLTSLLQRSTRHVAGCSNVLARLFPTRTLYVGLIINFIVACGISNCTPLSEVVNSSISTTSITIFTLFRQFRLAGFSKLTGVGLLPSSWILNIVASSFVSIGLYWSFFLFFWSPNIRFVVACSCLSENPPGKPSTPAFRRSTRWKLTGSSPL